MNFNYYPTGSTPAKLQELSDRLSPRGCSSGGVHVPVFIHTPGEQYHSDLGLCCVLAMSCQC